MASKNKKSREVQRKLDHKKRLAESKRRKRSETNLERPEPTIDEKPTILIICEGKNTEPSYFNQFKLTSADIESFGDGKNTITLVEAAIKHVEESDKKYEHRWVVFDKDEFPNQNFDNAIYKAQSNGFNVAYSNQAFEYWLILHFEAHNGGAMNRSEYCKRLNSHLVKFKHKYNCDSKIVDSLFFDILLSDEDGISRQDLAVSRAKSILKYYDGDTPSNSESSTLVFELVELLNKYK